MLSIFLLYPSLDPAHIFYTELFLKLSIYVLPFRRMRDEV
jgi:hypothetical protein